MNIDHWFGTPTSSRKVAAILEGIGIHKAEWKTARGMFGRKERILTRPGYEIEAAHGTSPVKLMIHAKAVHMGLTVMTTALDTDATRRAVEALKGAGLLVRFHTGGGLDVVVGKGLAPEKFTPRKDDTWWHGWMRERIPHWYTETPPALLDKPTTEVVAMAMAAAKEGQDKAVKSLSEVLR